MSRDKGEDKPEKPVVTNYDMFCYELGMKGRHVVQSLIDITTCAKCPPLCAKGCPADDRLRHPGDYACTKRKVDWLAQKAKQPIPDDFEKVTLWR